VVGILIGIIYSNHEELQMTSTAKLFMTGRSQAVRLPAEFRFEGSEVFIRRDSATGEVILSKRATSWAQLFSALDSFQPVADRFMKDRVSEPAQERAVFED
jgi:antitoxin VapB